MINYFIASKVPTSIAGKYEIEVNKVYSPDSVKVGSAVFSIEHGLISTICAFPPSWSQVEKQDAIDAAGLLCKISKEMSYVPCSVAAPSGVCRVLEEKEETFFSMLKNSFNWLLSPAFLDLAIKAAVTLSIIACLYNYGKFLFAR